MPRANIDLFLFKYASVRAQYLSLQFSWHFLTFILLLCISCKLITDKFNIYKHVMCLVLVIYCLWISIVLLKTAVIMFKNMINKDMY